jgi:hypothetical protein
VLRQSCQGSVLPLLLLVLQLPLLFVQLLLTGTDQGSTVPHLTLPTGAGQGSTVPGVSPTGTNLGSTVLGSTVPEPLLHPTGACQAPLVILQTVLRGAQTVWQEGTR